MILLELMIPVNQQDQPKLTILHFPQMYQINRTET